MNGVKMALMSVLLTVGAIPARAQTKALKLIDIDHGVYTFTTGNLVVKARCDYTEKYDSSGSSKHLDGFCNLDDIVGSTFEQDAGNNRPLHTYFYLTTEALSLTRYVSCKEESDYCHEHVRYDKDTWFTIVSMKNLKP